MRRSVRRLKGLGFILWHAKHELFHVLLGLVWAWFLRELWGEFNLRWIILSIVGSLAPDVDHLFYFFLYGRHDWYSQELKNLLKSRQWRNLTTYLEQGHKTNVSLATHNVFFVSFLVGCAILSSFIEWRVGVIFLGAMVIHYIFDIFDDIFILGKLNPNWKRLKRIKPAKLP